MAEEAAVAVCVRTRPLCSREEELGETPHVYWKAYNNTIYQIDGSKSFNFGRVFHSHETTKNIYDEIAVPIIESAIQGYNGTIFAYGQTASGKTHTMMGSQDCLGIIPRAIHDIFKKIKKITDREFLLRVSYMEIYNETVTDLLCNPEKMKPLLIREDSNRNVYVADLTEEVVFTSEMALQWISKGEKSRHYGITKMNQRSSRSHTIVRMILESREKGDSANCNGSIKVSHLNLVDLAGSERAAQTGAEGMRFQEGCNTNRSLFILAQVIKKLSDGQNDGFINYQDSNLTRILQNSLGGNAKTRIICTITSASFDETLTTLQFASTAKYMKNTPHVNEVSSDEALLKRYRKEIVDLKKHLEEISIKTRAQEMEKDQLAQLLDEKDLLQKVRDERIQNLKRMLVTSSCLASQQKLKAKKNRRVTWCLGEINKMKDSTYVDEFTMPSNVPTRSHHTSATILGERDGYLSVEPGVFSNTFEPLTEGEWSSATNLLSQNLESKLSSLYGKYDNLVLDNQQLRRENEELKWKFKERNVLDVFKDLERRALKDRENQLVHEIANLKDLVQNAEAHNQDLENELSSKVELLTEKEERIKCLQKTINSQKSDATRMALSYSLEITEDLKYKKELLHDNNILVLYAKRQLAFIRSENQELKEKIKELSTSCQQMEKDVQLYQSQLDAEKKIQVDFNKELQSAFNEIAKLKSLLDGNVPKDLLCNLESEEMIAGLQGELNKEAKENESLKKEVNLLSGLKSLPSEVEMLKKEIQKKSEQLTIITSEKEKLSSAIAHKDKKIEFFLEEMGKAKDDLAASQLNYKTIHMEFEEKYKIVLEENERMKREIENLSKESEIPYLSLDSLKTENQLVHEIANLKDLVQNAEAYNRDLENEVSSKAELLTKKEEHIKYLQKHLNSQKSEATRMALSYPSEVTEDLKYTKELLNDNNTLVFYAKRQLAFIRSENRELKEKITELSNSCKQTEKLYQNQLETEKKIQVDINKELQSALNEIAKLTSVLDGKVPKDFLCNLELEEKIVGLQRELNKEAKENESLKKEVNLLSGLKSLPSEVEMLKKEIHKKSEELTIITSEKEKLSSAIAHKDKKIQFFLEEMGKAKDDLAASQLNYKTLHMEFEEKYKLVLEDNERMKRDIENLSKESEIPDLSLDSLKTKNQLIHEIANLKDLVQNAEAHNCDLENELSSKVKLLTEKEEHIKYLQKHINSQKSEATRKSLSYSLEVTEDLKYTKELLHDNNTLVLYAKRQLSVIRDENWELKEKINQLIREIANLRDLVQNAEAHNRDLENELSSKAELLTEKEEHIKYLQKHINSQISEATRMSLSYSSEVTEDLKYTKELLHDDNTLVLYAKRQLSFIRSENRELKEKIKQLSNSCKQMEKDVQQYQNQLDAEKKIQFHLKKELHSALNEIAKITSLLDGKVQTVFNNFRHLFAN